MIKIREKMSQERQKTEQKSAPNQTNKNRNKKPAVDPNDLSLSDAQNEMNHDLSLLLEESVQACLNFKPTEQTFGRSLSEKSYWSVVSQN